MVIIQSVNPHTDAITTLAEFTLVGTGVHAVYHNKGFEYEMNRYGVYTAKTGKLRPSDGQAFLDALPSHFANSSLTRVIVSDGSGRTDWDPDQPRAENGQFSSGGGGGAGTSKATGKAFDNAGRASLGKAPLEHLQAANESDKAARDAKTKPQKEMHKAKAEAERAKAQVLQMKEAIVENAIDSSEKAKKEGTPAAHETAAANHKVAAQAAAVLGEHDKAASHEKIAGIHEKLGEKQKSKEEAEKKHAEPGEKGKKPEKPEGKVGGPSALDILHTLDGELALVHPGGGEGGEGGAEGGEHEHEAHGAKHEPEPEEPKASTAKKKE